MLISTAYSQLDNYVFEKQWQEIDTLILSKNLPKTALEKVNNLYKLAQQSAVDDQIIKCLIYRISLEDAVFDNKPNNAISILESEILTTKSEVVRSILYTLLANRYLQYYNANRWKYYNRGKTIDYKKTAIETWNADDFSNAIGSNFLKSIANEKLLQQVVLSKYDAIISKGNSRNLRPTLFDLLAHEALGYFKSGDYYLTKPAFIFELKDLRALSPVAGFIATDFKSVDTSSHLLLTLQLFQKLIQFHIDDADKNALVDVDLDRIEWVYQNLENEGKDTYYIDALNTLTKISAERASQAYYSKVQYFANKANNYQPFGDTTQRFANITAMALINEALKKHQQDDEGTANLKNLQNQILQPTVNIQKEKVTTSGKAFRALVTYKNIDTLFVRLIKLPRKSTVIENWNRDNFDEILALKSYQSFYQILPQTKDYQTHAVEIKMNALPLGEYVLVTSNGKGFINTVNTMSKQIVYVSNISYIKNGTDYFVLNRETGEPLNNVIINIKKNDGFVAKKKTNVNGYFSFKPKDDYGNYDFELNTKNDHLHLDNEYVYQPRKNKVDDYDKNEKTDYEEDNAKVYFFTDRAIYRPCQIVYFKGIAITKDFKTKQPKVLAGKDSLLVYLKDVNNKKIDSLCLKTNPYGSISGKFILPQNVLTGGFRIDADDFDNSRIDFSVEEYKRPKFYVEFEPVKGNYRLNDSVTVTGIAKAYAGNVIDGAKVVFNIQRNGRFVYDWLWRNGSRPYSRNTEITNGKITTDAEGKFKMTFKANADSSIDKNTEPLFDFSVNADVTDITGETRTANTLVTVGYKSLVLNIAAPKIAEADSLQEITITTKNLSNEKEPAVVTIKIYAIKTPERLIRQRLWQRADLYVMTKETYLQNFPNDDYADELNESNWPVNNLVAEGQINTATNSKFQISNFKLTAGYYKVEATTTDKYGNAIKDVKFMQLFSKNAAPYPQYNFNYIINNFAEPNTSASFLTSTMAEKIFIIRQTIRPNYLGKERKTYAYLSAIKGLQNLTYKADETDRGNVIISDAFVINNRLYKNQYNVIVPFSNKAMDVTYTSFRNKTEPGSKETWTVNIASNKGEKVAAELLTSMYDASLDQFKKQDWQHPNIWDITHGYNQFTSDNGFNTNRSEQNYYSKIVSTKNIIVYDKLLKPNNLNEYKIFREALSRKVSGLQIPIEGELNDVVVVGYGSVKKKDITGSVAAVSVRGNQFKNVAEENYDKVFTTVDITDPNTGDRILNGRLIKGTKRVALASTIQPRTNFNETAFFFPNIYADSTGNYSFSFTMPEALTQWKWQSFAHTKDLAFGSNTATITTQKTLMVQTNAPRFVREGDNLEFVTKIANLSDKELTGQVRLELVDATTNVSVDGWFQNVFPTQYFTVAAGQSSAIKFPIQIPYTFSKPLTWRVIATAGNFSDGEENTLPVLSNRMLVTETLPLLIKGDTTQHFVLEKLVNNTSETLTNQSLTVEYTANPIWAAVQALPYLIEYPYECAEQTFNRFYANALAMNITAKHPRIKQVFEQWKNDTTALKSNLVKNEALKQILLQETPWVLQAENEGQQQNNLALLFDVVSMSNGASVAIDKLQQMQLPSGGFAWFKGGKEDRYITNYILTGIGKLKKINTLPMNVANKLEPIINKALTYLDTQLQSDYESLLKNKVDLAKNQLSNTQIQYLFMRSFYKNSSTVKVAYNYYYNQAKQYWQQQNTYNTAMIGLVLYRNNEQRFVTTNLLPAIVENAVEDTSKAALYWKDRTIGFWYQSPIEHQCMMLQFLNELYQQEPTTSLAKSNTDAKTWLILNKQTNNWKTTIATADACYSLLANAEALNTTTQLQIQLGDYTLKPSTKQAGTGYFKSTIQGDKIAPQMGNVTVTTESNNQAIKQSTISYGSLYWQYFEDFDKITVAASPLSITKQLFVETNSVTGKILTPVKDNDELKVGDKVVIQLVLKTDRDMDYVHLKDTRAATMEPMNVLSEYKYQDGLGYYEATKDASTNFFFSNIRKGTYVFEYPLYITHIGTFSVGIASLQCMYAPEFTSHSEGGKIRVIGQ